MVIYTFILADPGELRSLSFQAVCPANSLTQIGSRTLSVSFFDRLNNGFVTRNVIPFPIDFRLWITLEAQLWTVDRTRSAPNISKNETVFEKYSLGERSRVLPSVTEV
jgi:hypothetical protein